MNHQYSLLLALPLKTAKFINPLLTASIKFIKLVLVKNTVIPKYKKYNQTTITVLIKKSS